VIDIGAGQSTLVEDLLDRGLNQLTVLDISDKAIHETQTRLRERSSSVHWVVSDILTTSFPPHSFDIWHDRVVFHFLTQSEERSKYVEQLKHALKPSGYVIIATFGPEGPLKCSGLPVCRYDVSALMAEFGTSFELKEHVMEWHETPTAASQQFLYVVMQMK
jgi:2-polyprenyl-3-methyl-5-hydroxy-6-metoxy-1,4-benzoquinol methylase